MKCTKFLLSAAIGPWLAGLLIATAPALAADKGFEFQVFFGTAIPQNKQPCNGILTSVTDDLWESFVANNIAKEFPHGFTVANASGHWQDAQTGAPVSEDSRVLILVAKDADEAATLDKLAGLITFYLNQFCQDSVLYISTPMFFAFAGGEDVDRDISTE